MEQRYLKMHDIKTREADDQMVIEGYFAVYGDIYEVWPGATESIAPGAFAEALGGDIRALYNHDHDIVLGRTGPGTLTLRDDDRGLWGSIAINPKDSDAVNAYERIARGDVSGCSIGFDIVSERTDIHDDGSVHWTIEKINPLYEVSPCTFPAYTATSIEARGRDMAKIKKRELEAVKAKMLAQLKGETHGTESTTAQKEG